MADIPQEVREAAAKLAAISELRPLLLSGEHDDHLYIEVCHAMLLAGKRAGMERAAEIAEDAPVTLPFACGVTDGASIAIRAIAQAIRSEADG